MNMTREELLALPATIDLVTAAQALGMGRTKAYELVRTGEFPVRVLSLGNRKRIVTQQLLELLGVERSQAPSERSERYWSPKPSRMELEARRRRLQAELAAWRSQDEIQAELDEFAYLLGEEA